MTWVISSSGKNLSVIKADLDKYVSIQSVWFEVVNRCKERNAGFCETSLFIKKHATTMKNHDLFGVTVYFTGREPELIGCEWKNITTKGYHSFVFFVFMKQFYITCILV